MAPAEATRSASLFTLASGADGNERESESFVESLAKSLATAASPVIIFAVPAICGKGHRSNIVANSMVSPQWVLERELAQNLARNT
jgi:hypothetical protein